MSRFKWILQNMGDGSVYQLLKDPRGWEQLSKKLYRSERYHGIFSEPSQKQLTFFKNGGGLEFLYSIYLLEDINANVEIRCLSLYNGSYKELFRCKVNLANFTSDQQTVSCNVEQSNLYSKILAREEINVDLRSTTSIGQEPITAPDYVTLPLASVIIPYDSAWSVENGYLFSHIEAFSSAASFQGFFVPLGGNTASDFTTTNPLTEFADFNPSTGSFQQALVPDIMKMIQAGVTYPLNIDYNVQFAGSVSINNTISGGSAYDARLRLNIAYGKKTAPTIINLYDSGVVSGDPIGFSYDTLAQSGSFTLMPGDQVWLYWVINTTHFGGSVTLATNMLYTKGTLSLHSDTSYKPTTVDAMMIHEAMNQVIDSIADSDGNFESEFYGRTDSAKVNYPADGEGSLLCFKSGLKIRGFTDKSIFANWKTLFDSANALHNIGMGIVGGKVKVEKLNFFYRSKRIVTLGKVKKFIRRNSNQHYITKMEVGYDNWESEFKGGLDEPCTKHQYSTKVHGLKNDVSFTSKYISSSYAYELTRRKNITDYPAEDFRYDNENFWLALVRVGSDFRAEYFVDSFATGANMLALNSALNLRLTPKRMLLAFIGRITAGLQTIGGVIKFMSGEGNTGLETATTGTGNQESFNGQTLAENADIAYNDSNALNIVPLWKPEFYEFEYPITDEQLVAIESDPHGFIEFYETPDEILRGFIWEMEYKLSNGMTSFKLLKKNGN